VLKAKFCLPPTRSTPQPHLFLHTTTKPTTVTVTTSLNQRIYLHTHCLNPTQPTTHGAAQPKIRPATSTSPLSTTQTKCQVCIGHSCWRLCLREGRNAFSQVSQTRSSFTLRKSSHSYVPSFPFPHTPVNTSHPLD
jgi:hypothetical protein